MFSARNLRVLPTSASKQLIYCNDSPSFMVRGPFPETLNTRGPLLINKNMVTKD